MKDQTTNAFRDAAGFALIAAGVLLTLVCGLSLVGALIDWGTGMDFTSAAEPVDAKRHPGADALLSLLGIACGVICVKLARRVQIPKQLRELFTSRKEKG